MHLLQHREDRKGEISLEGANAGEIAIESWGFEAIRLT
jgi:hypothetical protein